MKYAIIAAGEGSRLAHEGIEEPKPLVRVGGERIVDRLIRIFSDNKAEEITVICNDKSEAVGRHLEEVRLNGINGRRIPLNVVVRSTPSSMHSFFEIRNYLKDAPFCLTTVDTIFNEKEFSEYISEFLDNVNSGTADGVMGVTDFVDDEKPLYVATDESLNITGFLDRNDNCRFISGGIYGLTPQSVSILEDCVNRGESRMRNFQRALVSAGMRLKAKPFGKILDIDHATDIVKAEQFLKGKE